MIIRCTFTLLKGKPLFFPTYGNEIEHRCPWGVWENSPGYRGLPVHTYRLCEAMSFLETQRLSEGESCSGRIQPISPELWKLEIGDVIFAWDRYKPYLSAKMESFSLK